jgi:hypothetical protein
MLKKKWPMNYIGPILLVLPFLGVFPCGTTQSYSHPIIYSYINIHVNILKAKSHEHEHFIYKIMQVTKNDDNQFSFVYHYS